MTITIPPYYFKRGEEVLRAVGLAVGAYLVQVLMTWDAEAFADPWVAARSIGAGAVTVGYAALRVALKREAAEPAP